MSKINQSQVKDLFVNSIADAASVGKADGRKIIYVRETGLWYAPATGTPTVDGLKHIAGAGTTWSAISSTPLFPATPWATSTVYNVGQIVVLPGGTIAWCNVKHTSSTLTTDSSKWEPISQISTKVRFFADVSQAYADAFTFFYVAGALYYAIKLFTSSSSVTVKGTACIPIAPGEKLQPWIQGWNYPRGTPISYQGSVYRAALDIFSAAAAPLINDTALNQLLLDWNIPQGNMILANGGVSEAPSTGKIYVHYDQRLTVSSNTVYRYYVGTLTDEFTEIHSNVSNCKILAANFHVETFLGESRTGTKAYEEFVPHNNSSDESRVRVVLDGTSLKIQQGANVKVTGGYVDFEGVVSGQVTFAQVGMRKSLPVI